LSGQDQKQVLADLYERYYVAGFRANDVGLINRIVHYPLAYIKDGSVRMVDHFPVDPAKLKAELGWDHSKDWAFEVIAVGERQAHVNAYATRCRADGSEIERVQGFYAFKKIGNDWKMFALADIVF